MQGEIRLRVIDEIIENTPLPPSKASNLSPRDRARLSAFDRPEVQKPTAVVSPRQQKRRKRAKHQAKPCRSACGNRR